VILNSHAEGVDQDAEEDEALENVVVNKLLKLNLECNMRV
jgi:hypothetical protein